jgi:hypothetical protein
MCTPAPGSQRAYGWPLRAERERAGRILRVEALNFSGGANDEAQIHPAGFATLLVAAPVCLGSKSLLNVAEAFQLRRHALTTAGSSCTTHQRRLQPGGVALTLTLSLRERGHSLAWRGWTTSPRWGTAATVGAAVTFGYVRDGESACAVKGRCSPSPSTQGQ